MKPVVFIMTTNGLMGICLTTLKKISGLNFEVYNECHNLKNHLLKKWPDLYVDIVSLKDDF